MADSAHATAPPLIGLAHGSRDARAAAGIAELMRAVEALQPGLTARPAFLDLSEPDLTRALGELDVSAAVVVPLLFSEAFHARVDTPQAVTQAQDMTGVMLRTAAILGMGLPVLAALATRAEEAGIDDIDEVVLLAVGSSQESANQSVRDLAGRWAAIRTGGVTAAFATCQPRATDELARLRRDHPRVAVAPLFLAPGLLLDQVIDSPEAIGCPVAAAIGTSLAGLVLQRYRDALAGGRGTD